MSKNGDFHFKQKKLFNEHKLASFIFTWENKMTLSNQKRNPEQDDTLNSETVKKLELYKTLQPMIVNFALDTKEWEFL